MWLLLLLIPIIFTLRSFKVTSKPTPHPGLGHGTQTTTLSQGGSLPCIKSLS
jgi:hypothetical protein